MSGWTFPGWKGRFYPKGLSAKKELEFASRQVTSIEVNGTFYRVLAPKSFESWYQMVPPDFVFSLKAPKFVTHVRRGKDVDSGVANFLASGIFLLKEKLGPILWQFPPNVMLKDDRFDKFAALLPKDVAQAEKLAQNHSEWLNGKAVTSATGVGKIRHAIEFRHPSFFNRDFLQMLAGHGIAAVFAHGGKKDLYTEQPTADFVYARMHGQGKGFKKGYPLKVLGEWVETLRAMGAKKKGPKAASIYFDTEEKKYSPDDAKHLIEILKKA